MLFETLLSAVNPVRMFRRHLRDPFESFVQYTFDKYKRRTNDGINSVREVVYKSGIIAVFASAILWLSIFLYVVFYYTYMPNITHMRPVHLQFESCENRPGLCSFPSAHVQLKRRQPVLMVGQPYRIRLTLDMPESQPNKELGMFMVCTELRSVGKLVSSSCRSVMLRHRSPVHQLMRTIVLAPFLLADLHEEKQKIHVELFSDFEDDQNQQVTDAYVEVQTRYAQLYSAALHLEAHFTGLRYLMFHWPVMSATLGISTNLFFVALVFVLSWYHLQESSTDVNEFVKVSRTGSIEKEGSFADEKYALRKKIKLEKQESLADASFLEDSGTVVEEMNRMDTSSTSC